MRHITFSVFLLICLLPAANAQNQVWEVTTLSNEPYNNAVLDSLSDKTLVVKAYGKNLPIPVDSIKFLKRKRKSLAGLGIIFGGTAGGVWAIERSKGPSDNPFNGSSTMLNIGFGAIVGGTVGLILGEGMGTDEVYNVEKRDHIKKVELLSKLIARNKNIVKK